MKTKKNSLKALESQEINSEKVVGGTKQSWNDENAKPLFSNDINEGRRTKFLRKAKLGGISLTGPSEES